MHIPRKIFFLLFPLALTNANANSQNFELAFGQTEGIDLKYGYECPYIGVAITPGLGLFIASKIRADEVVPTTWNPSVSIFKTIQLTEHIELVPNLAAIYWFGRGGMLGGSTCMNCGEIQTRDDQIYVKAGLGFQDLIRPWFIQFNPGIVFHRNYTHVIKNDGSYVYRKNNTSNFDGIYLSGSVGFKLGNY